MKINAYKPIDQYTYIGFGATHMEDFKQIHSFFGLNKLISIEQDKSIYKRQHLNKPLNCIELKNCDSGSFIQEFDFDDNCIIWLDYVSPRQINEQIREFQTVIDKCGPYDVIKISLNANPNTLAAQSENEERESTYKKRLSKLESRIAPFLNEGTDFSDMTLQGLPKILLGALINAANDISKSSNSKFFPISSFVYTDFNHQMLTLTGIILEKDSDFLESIQIENWKYSYQPEKKIFKINIPDLTLKERIIIDSMLPCNDYTLIVSELGYEDIPAFDNSIKNYVQYYRHFPSFSKVIL